MLYFGELITQSDGTEIEIIHIHYEIEIIGNHGKVKVIHKIKNTSNEDCNVRISLQLDDESVVTGYSFITENGEFISKLKENKQAKQEKNDATVNGYSSTVMEKEDDTTFIISLGLFSKQSEVSFSIEYLTRFDIDDDHLIMKIPQLMSGEKEIPFSLEIKENEFKHEGIIKNVQEIEIPIPKEMMISMIDEDTDEIVIASTFVNKENKGDCKVIFLCDRSGSMDGEGIQSLKEMLQLFLRQLPMNCEFQIVSFGNKFKFMFDEMTKYSEDILKMASEKVKEFQANFGGTEMFKPLEQLLKDKIENTHIICLTDGEDFEKERCLTAMKELAKKNTIHGVGLGSDCDVDFIRRAGRIGNGISVISKDMTKLREEVSKITQRILIPSINNCEIKWNIKGELTPTSINNFNGITTCFISCDDDLKKNQEIQCELKGKCEGNEIIFKNVSNYKKQKGILLHQLMAFQQIKKLESENKTKEATKLSLKYNVLCKSTAFIAIDRKRKKQVTFIKNVSVEIDDVDEYKYKAKRKKSSSLFSMIFSRKKNYSCTLDNGEFVAADNEATNILNCDDDYYVPPTKNNTKIENKFSKSQVFDELVLKQKANGEFDDMSNVLKEVNELKTKEISFTILQTYFIVEMLKEHFKERKGEWRLLVKKSEQWLSSQQEIPQDIKDEILNIIQKMKF